MQGCGRACYMNGMMESVIQLLINQIPNLSSRGEPFVTLVIIVSIDSFLDPIHGLIQVAHCGFVTINQSKDIYQRFTNDTYLTYCTLESLVMSHKLGYGFPILFGAIYTSFSLIRKKHPL